MKTIPVFRPLIRQEEIAAAVGALEMGWLGMGSYVGRFEEGIKSYLEAPDRYVAHPDVNNGQDEHPDKRD